MLKIDLTGKRAFVAGVADDGGFGFAIAKALAEAGASICVGTWPPALGIFTKLLERGKIAGSLQLSDGSGKLEFERIYPLDAAFDALADAPAEVRENKRYHEAGRRFGVRVNAISAGPWASRAASAIGFIEQMIAYTSANSPLPRPIRAEDVGHTAAFLASPFARAITGSIVYVDAGYHVMGMAVAAAPPPAT